MSDCTHEHLLSYPDEAGLGIREIPDHATFRGKGVNTGLVRQTRGLSLFGPM